MPFYSPLRSDDSYDKRTIQKILELRKALKEQIPERTLSKTLLLATWNIRDFDKKSYGYRLKESYFYLAEIISAFDIVALQEVYQDLAALDRLMSILGGHWKYVFSDTTKGRRGNHERLAYLYDSRKVKFGGLAGELVLPPIEEEVIIDGKKTRVYRPVNQIWRTPLICGFQAGWAKFMVSSVHIQWGSSKANSPERIKEIQHIAEFLKERTEDPTAWARKLILLGDFNIFSNKDLTYKALKDCGFESPEPLVNVMTNMGKEKRPYDKILIRERERRFEVLAGGTFHFFDYVFKEEEEEIYQPLMVKPEQPGEFYSNYSSWRTHQISDHLPLWVELKIDYADEYLQDKLTS